MSIGNEVDISVLIGKVITKIEGGESDYFMTFDTEEGPSYIMWHNQDCCEHVRILDITGDIKDLLGSPITMAEESTNVDDRMGMELGESFTWTFYRLATVKGYVTIRWLGESNGYYSERVTFEQRR